MHPKIPIATNIAEPIIIADIIEILFFYFIIFDDELNLICLIFFFQIFKIPNLIFLNKNFNIM
jgi:hypothetical protein